MRMINFFSIRSSNHSSLKGLATVAVLALAWGATDATAAVDVLLTPGQIDAVKFLLKPEETALRLHGRTAFFLPGPTYRFLGATPSEFPIDLGAAGGLADVRFDALEARGMNFGFEAGRIRAEVPFVDRDGAIQTAIGAVNFKSVVLVVWLKLSESPTGALTLVQDGAELRGTLQGTGLIGPSLIAKLRAGAVDAMKKQVDAILAKPETPAKVELALLKYAQFSKEPLAQRYVPGTIAIDPAGLSYQAE